LVPPSLDELELKWNSGRELDGIMASVEQRGLVEPGHTVASADNWQRSAILCFRLDCEYLGHPQDDTETERRSELVDAGVDRYLVWSSGADAPGLERLDGPDRLGGLRIFQVDDATQEVPR
jgi:hypothetical protein